MANITYRMSQMDLGTNITITPEETRRYIQEKIEGALSVFNTHHEVSGTVVCRTEGVHGRKVQKVDITLNILGTTIHQSAHSRSMKKAMDKAATSLERQVHRLKTRCVDKRSKNNTKRRRQRIPESEPLVSNIEVE